jgi:hypothetical protein
VRRAKQAVLSASPSDIFLGDAPPGSKIGVNLFGAEQIGTIVGGLYPSWRVVEFKGQPRMSLPADLLVRFVDPPNTAAWTGR